MDDSRDQFNELMNSAYYKDSEEGRTKFMEK